MTELERERGRDRDEDLDIDCCEGFGGTLFKFVGVVIVDLRCDKKGEELDIVALGEIPVVLVCIFAKSLKVGDGIEEEDETDGLPLVETIDRSSLFSSFKVLISCRSFRTIPSCSFSISTIALARGCAALTLAIGVESDGIFADIREGNKGGQKSG